MYSETDILKNVTEINNILKPDEFQCLKDIIINSNIKFDNVFKESPSYIDLLNNSYVTKTLYPIIKKRFNYDGVLQKVFCKIQSHTEYEEYNIISEDINTIVFSLDINLDNNYNVTRDEIVNIVKNKRGEEFSSKEIDMLQFNNDSLVLPLSYNDCRLNREFYLEKQNLLDKMGYLYIVPSDKHENTGFGFEHINNNCIKFPGYYIHKMKPYFKFSNIRRISIIFICKYNINDH
jgi:hypothetical protein